MIGKNSAVFGLKKLVAAVNKLIDKSKKKDNTSVIVGYTANYALYVHENIEMKWKGKPRKGRKGRKGKGFYWDPQGIAQAKFLEEPFRTLQPELIAIIKAAYHQTGNMEQSLLVAGFRLQRESQKKVPVDTGNLKASAFTRVDKNY